MKAFERLIPMADVTLDDVAAFAARNEWQYLGDRPGSMVPGHEWVWATADRQTAISYVDDQAIGLRYLAIQGRDRTGLADAFRAELPIVDKSTVLGILSTAPTPNDIAGSLYLVGAFANEFDADVFAAIEEALAHDSPRVRQAAIFAALMAEWSELEPALARLEAREPESDVREMARTALEHLRPYWEENR